MVKINYNNTTETQKQRQYKQQKTKSILIKDRNYYGYLPKQNLWDNPYKFGKKYRKFYHDGQLSTTTNEDIQNKVNMDRKIEEEYKKSKIWDRKKSAKLIMEKRMIQRTALQKSSSQFICGGMPKKAFGSRKRVRSAINRRQLLGKQPYDFLKNSKQIIRNSK